ncbi:MAG: TPR end-of-group domain-containing protein [Gaiellaceae bacterium]
MSGYQIVTLSELDRIESPGNPVLGPLRHTLGVTAFGVNAYTGDQPGDAVIVGHREPGGPEELYVVVSGHATFTVGQDTVEAPAGTLVHVPPDTFRAASADQPSTMVLAVGARVGEAFAPSGWEDFYVADAMRRRGDLTSARAALREGIARDPLAWQGHYNAACFEALAGDVDAALVHLRHALSRNRAEVRRLAPDDSDLDALRGDPRFGEAIG